MSVAVALVVAATLASCSSTPERLGRRVDPTFESAFEALELAVDDHQDELARRILQGIEARSPAGDTREQMEAFRRVLDGRALGRSLDLRLDLRRRKDGRYRVDLLASYPGLDHLSVISGPGRLSLLLSGIDPGGFEQKAASSTAVFGTGVFEIRPGEVTRIRLGDFELPIGAALAVRATWDLSLMPGEVVRGDAAGVPVNDFRVRSGQTVRLASFLPTDPVPPEELARYLAGDVVSLPAMIERAVRIPVDQRAEALDLLGPVVESMTLIELERAVPVLRWLSGQRELGGDPARWRAWMALRTEQVEAAGDEEPENTDLVLPSAG